MRRTISSHEELRRRCGFTQAQLAERIGYARPYVSRIEGGDAKPSPRYRRAVAEALGVPADWLFPEFAHDEGPAEEVNPSAGP